MEVYTINKITDTPPYRKRVVALGFFDGVHIGHRELLRRAESISKERGCLFSVFTFPSESFDCKVGGRLYPTEEKLDLLRSLGVEEVILAEFSVFKNMPAEEFAEKFLIDSLGLEVGVSGGDFRFGLGARGDAETLRRIFNSRGKTHVCLDDVCIDGVKVSTTEIKNRLCAADIPGAERMLGAPYFIRSSVTHGRGVGHTLGFPTLNCEFGVNRGILRHGVYLSVVNVDGADFPAITNVGVCPTFDEREEHAETYVLKFSGNLYGKKITITPRRFLRDEKKFPSDTELQKQVLSDIDTAIKEFYEYGK